MTDRLIIEDITIPVVFVRSRRKTLSISITNDLKLLVKAPLSMPEKEIDKFIRQKNFWIYKQMKRMEKEAENRTRYTPEQEREYREKARRVLTEKSDHYKKILGVDYKKIRIGDQKTRWGSCSSIGTISYNWRLILMPEEIQDYVVVHELCHLIEMNHSKAFWEKVESVIPDYARRRAWLKKNGER